MVNDIYDCSTNEIYELLLEHDKRHGYTFLNNNLFKEKIELKGSMARDFLLAQYEQRTDNWENFKKTILNQLKSEAVSFDIELVEHEQGSLTTKNGKQRKKPSLWSVNGSAPPSSVEDAAAAFFSARGYSVSNAFGYLERILLKAYCHTFSAKNNLWLFRDNPIALKDINNVSEAELSSSLEKVTVEFVKEHIQQSIRGGPLANKERLNRLRDMKISDLIKLLEVEFCNLVILGAEDITDLNKKLILVHNNWPKKFLSDYYQQVSLYSICSGIPDLFIWNDLEMKFVEVKSPSDRVHHRQAEFYHYVLKPMKMNFHLANVKVKKYIY